MVLPAFPRLTKTTMGFIGGVARQNCLSGPIAQMHWRVLADGSITSSKDYQCGGSTSECQISDVQFDMCNYVKISKKKQLKHGICKSMLPKYTKTTGSRLLPALRPTVKIFCSKGRTMPLLVTMPIYCWKWHEYETLWALQYYSSWNDTCQRWHKHAQLSSAPNHHVIQFFCLACQGPDIGHHNPHLGTSTFFTVIWQGWAGHCSIAVLRRSLETFGS